MSIKSIRTGWTGISALAGNDQWFSDFESIASVTIESTSSTLQFTNIPTDYQHLQIRLISRVSNADTGDNAWLRFNGDSGTNYSWHYFEGDGGSTPAAGGAGGQTWILAARTSAANASTGIFGAAVIDILDYRNTNKHKTTRSLTGLDRNGSGNIRMDSGSWLSLNAINSISISNGSATNFVQYTHAALYGIRG